MCLVVLATCVSLGPAFTQQISGLNEFQANCGGQIDQPVKLRIETTASGSLKQHVAEIERELERSRHQGGDTKFCANIASEWSKIAEEWDLGSEH